MKLYYKQGACSLSPHIVLLESGLDFTLVLVDLHSKKTEQHEDYLSINSKGQVPALELDDGTVLTEGPAIVQYIADLKPDRELLAPVGSLTRYQTLSWLNFVATELHKTFSPLFSSATPDEYKAQLRKKLQQKFSWVNNELIGRQWLTGLRFSVADVYLFTVMRWSKALKLNLDDLDQLKAWYARVAERPSVVQALQAEGL